MRAGRILVCERLGVPDAWQFPQGGIDGERDAGAGAGAGTLGGNRRRRRKTFTIVSRRGPFRYLYGNGRIKRGFHGKEQIYFLCDYSGADDDIEVETGHSRIPGFSLDCPGGFPHRLAARK